MNNHTGIHLPFPDGIHDQQMVSLELALLDQLHQPVGRDVPERSGKLGHLLALEGLARVGSGLRALLADVDRFEEAWHCCNVGLLAGHGVTADQLKTTKRYASATLKCSRRYSRLRR